MSKTPNPRPWSVPLTVQDVPPEGRHDTLIADAATCAAIAKLARIPAILQLQASFDSTPRARGGLHVSGEVTARVAQTCVVTLDPLESDIVEPVDLVFVAGEAGETLDADMRGEAGSEPELLIDGTVDLGVIATEFLLLGIEPYPRKPGAVFAPPAPQETEVSPFAVLGSLKKDAGRR